MEGFLERIENRVERAWLWFKERAHGRHATGWLAALSFGEASLFLVTPEVLLVPILLAGSARWRFYAGITTLASVAGGIFGYFLGAFFFDVVGARLVAFYHLGDVVAQAGALFHGYTFWTIFLAAFTPLPYKAFVLAGGFLKVNFFSFVIASLIGRAARFYLLAYIVRRFGEHALRLVTRYAIAATVTILVIFTAFLLVKFGIL